MCVNIYKYIHIGNEGETKRPLWHHFVRVYWKQPESRHTMFLDYESVQSGCIHLANYKTVIIRRSLQRMQDRSVRFALNGTLRWIGKESGIRFTHWTPGQHGPISLGAESQFRSVHLKCIEQLNVFKSIKKIMKAAICKSTLIGFFISGRIKHFNFSPPSKQHGWKTASANWPSCVL